MRVREHRGNSLEESLATMVNIEPTSEALTEHINSVLAKYEFRTQPESITVTMLMDEPDHRTGWERTCAISVDGYGFFGFCDQLVG
jgi:hypothetical protein